MEKKLTTGPGLMIAIPTLGRPVNLDWALAFKALNPPINYNIVFSIVHGQEVGIARNELARQAIEKNTKYLFFLGDDVIVPPHTLRQLIFRMENDPTVGVVGGVYCSKTEIPYPLIFKGNGQGAYWDWKIGEYFECTGIGMDCTLIRTSLLSELGKEQFKTVDKDDYLDGINNAESWTEDLYFCNRVLKETNYKVMVDTSVMCQHFDIYSNKVYTLPNSLPYRQRSVSGRSKCLMLGPKVELNEDYEIIYCTETDDPSYDYRVAFNNLPFDMGQFDWVIVTKHIEHMPDKELKEWLRVAKDKVSFNTPDFFNRDVLAKVYNGTVNGSFIEITKEIPKEWNNSSTSRQQPLQVIILPEVGV